MIMNPVKVKGEPWTLEHHKELLRLRYEEGLFYRQISELFGGVCVEQIRSHCDKAERLERQGKL